STLIGEWGAFSGHPATPALTKSLLSIFERYLWSHTYWCYTSDLKDMPFVKALNRAYPQATGGELTSYHYDDEAEELTVTFVPSGLETVIYYPKTAQLTRDELHLSKGKIVKVDFQPYVEADGGVITVTIPPMDEEVTLTIG